MRSERVDVAIVGAGPAGATLAARLARSGVDVQVLERAPTWRWRAGGVFASVFTVAASPALLAVDLGEAFCGEDFGLEDFCLGAAAFFSAFCCASVGVRPTTAAAITARAATRHPAISLNGARIGSHLVGAQRHGSCGARTNRRQ